ncbi:sensor histidine kinase [Metabacillus malikii]|uniref:histidine kinase n=1 Tax=Metabacillus malikii TaxID=1504265 RepID=A0ABT9ZCU9_9BACI|nr:histidine kinase [Metabacillus malikii]MDQ0230095.1 sensor histidine kinase YesM [Metabacillus malikii]
MIKLRTKLLIYFATILLLFVIIFLIREQSNENVIGLYKENEQSQFLLNQLTNQTTQTFDTLQIYVHEPLQENLNTLEKNKQKLIQLKKTFQLKENHGVKSKNYINIISSFLESVTNTVEAVTKQDIEAYSFHLQEANRTSIYIHELTLDIINENLTTYQKIAKISDEKIKYTKLFSLSLIVLLILISILFALWFSTGITRTIAKLTNAAKEISARRYNVEDVVVSRKDELWFLTKTFNEMKQNILASMSEIEEKAKLAQLLKEMELKSLQNQINPHFLFNTLNTISKTAFIEGAENTSELISSMSTLLRYNIGSLDRQTYLRDEVKIVKEYFFIQQTRFGDRVEFREKIDTKCLAIPIPCLTLQPVVENAFIHGIEHMAEGAVIELKIYEANDFVVIEVSDNGIGMDKTTIHRLLNDKDAEVLQGSGHSTGIGMRNVMDRLRLFQKESKFEINSMPGKGTTVRIKLRKEANDD